MMRAVTRPRAIPARMVGNAVIGILVFLSGFVLFEPAPSDLLLCAVVAFWAFAGLKLSRPMLPMIVLMLVYMAGGLLSLTQLDSFGRASVYMATTGFLIISSVFFAAVIQTDTERRLRTIERSYIASALVCAVLGILGYFDAIPYSATFTLYDRAKGAFKDPNVFGPFLVLPLAVLTRSVLTDRLHRTGWRLIGIFILFAGLFLSFSRAAWGMAIVSLLVVVLLAFISEQSEMKRLRMIAYLAAGLLALTILVSILLSLPAVQDLFGQRFRLFQEYDARRLGRFDRHLLGFFLIQEHPLGLGPFEFGKMMGEDEHNMWLKGFTAYGWIGGFAYIALVVWTFLIAVPLLLRSYPWTPFIQCVFAVYVGHLVVHNVIDNDHWRHLFLIYGLLWGAHALDYKAKRKMLAQPTARAMVFGPVALPRAN
jgi:hypothetical protein